VDEINTTVAKPRWARVRFPVVAVPAIYSVNPEPCVMLKSDEVLLKIVNTSLAANVDAGTVTPPV
jgi:hypothetical protein